MKEITFQKYSVYGNTFVLIDETRDEILSESEKSRFAGFAVDPHFGIGADNLIVVQPCTSANLQAINAHRKYWLNGPPCREATFIFRMFEPNGDEAFSCGNGVMCIADHLHRTHGVCASSILHQIPTDSPCVIDIGCEPDSGMAWANLGFPIPPPIAMASIGSTPGPTKSFSEIRDIPLTLHSLHVNGQRSEVEVKITGYLVYTGEPHLVIFTNTGISNHQVTEALFPDACGIGSGSIDADLEADNSCWLVHHIGSRINRSFAFAFPFGINVDFVRMRNSGHKIEYRCYERGINHETLACGTGAVAVTAVSYGLGFCGNDETIVWPHRCRWQYPDSEFTVKRLEAGWYVYGTPRRLYHGHLTFV